MSRIAHDVAAGNAAYLAGDYGGAVARFEAAIEAGADGADLLFNLGNALYRTGEHGRAALAFERALRRDPADDGARENLALIRSQLRGEGAPEPLWMRAGARVEVDQAAAVLLLCWSLGCAAWLVRLVLPGVARKAAALLAVVLAFAGLGAGAAALAAHGVRAAGWAVVVEAGELRRAPEPSASVVLPAPAGLRVRADRQIGGYVHVTAGGGSGWIEAQRVEPIDPPRDRLAQ